MVGGAADDFAEAASGPGRGRQDDRARRPQWRRPDREGGQPADRRGQHRGRGRGAGVPRGLRRRHRGGPRGAGRWPGRLQGAGAEEVEHARPHLRAGLPDRPAPQGHGHRHGRRARGRRRDPPGRGRGPADGLRPRERRRRPRPLGAAEGSRTTLRTHDADDRSIGHDTHDSGEGRRGDPEARGRHQRLRVARGRDQPLLQGDAGQRRAAPHPGPPRRGRLAHGRGLHPRQGGQHRRLRRDQRAGRHRHDHRPLLRERRLDPDPLHHRAGAGGEAAQGGLPGRRHRQHRQAADQDGGHGAGGGPGARNLRSRRST